MSKNKQMMPLNERLKASGVVLAILLNIGLVLDMTNSFFRVINKAEPMLLFIPICICLYAILLVASLIKYTRDKKEA